MSQPARTIIGFLSLTVVLFVLVALFYPVSYGGGQSKKANAMSNLKQIGLAVAIYSEDYDERFPPDMSSASNTYPYIQSFIKNEAVTKSLNPGHPEFLGNGILASAKFKTSRFGESTLMFFDSAPWEKSNARLVLFVDYHVKPMMEPEFQATLANHWISP